MPHFFCILLLTHLQCLRIAAALLLVTGFTCLVAAEEAPPTLAEIQQLMQERPLSLESWPVWRDYYIRLHFAYDVATPDDFYDQTRAFIGGVAKANSGKLPGEMALDSVAHNILARYANEQDPEHPRQALSLARQALELGDPEGMSTLTVASSLISVVISEKGGGQLSPDGEQLLAEASDLLDKLEIAEPQSRLSTYRGMIAYQRGDPSALQLLKQGADEHPLQAGYAANYLMFWVNRQDANEPSAEATASYLEKFPDNARLKAIHALALYRDGRIADAYESWREARQQDEKVVKFLGPSVVAILEEAQWATPDVIDGVELMKAKQFYAACPKFRAALEADPNNNVAARLLMRALVNYALSSRARGDTQEMRKLVAEGLQLTQQFPLDADMRLSHALLLNHAGQRTAAAEALDKAEQLGVKHEQIPGFDYVREIRDGAKSEYTQRTTGLIFLGVLTVFAVWLLLMFSLGSALAMFRSRLPRPRLVGAAVISTGEVWLERFYLLVLSLSLAIFYLSVPFVALGLLAITLLLLGIMLVVRVIHFGILHRGLYAVWGVLRCVFLGPSHHVFGLEAKAQEHPRLFATLNEVATRLETTPVDKAYFTPDSQLSVHEGGSGPFGLLRRRRIIQISPL